MPNYLDRFKMAPCPLMRDGFFIPNLIKTYLCGIKNGKEYATEYSTPEEWARLSPKSSCVKTQTPRI